jgi:hypothetical protein
MFLNPLLKADLVNRTFLLGTIRTLSFGGDMPAAVLDTLARIGVAGPRLLSAGY